MSKIIFKKSNLLGISPNNLQPVSASSYIKIPMSQNTKSGSYTLSFYYNCPTSAQIGINIGTETTPSISHIITPTLVGGVSNQFFTTTINLSVSNQTHMWIYFNLSTHISNPSLVLIETLTTNRLVPYIAPFKATIWKHGQSGIFSNAGTILPTK